MQRHHLEEGGLEGSTNPPSIYDVSFLPVNRTFETVLLLQKQYVTQTETPKDHYDPNNLLK